MEQARISTSQGTQSPAQTARTRAHTQQKGGADDGAGGAAQPDSFLALLAAQDPEFAEGGDPLAITLGAADASSTLTAVDPSTLVGWQALVAGDSAAQQRRGLAGQGGSAEGMTTMGLLGQNGVARGAAANTLADPAGSASALAGPFLAGQGLPAADGLVSQTTALDGGLLDTSQPATATLGFGRQFSRMHSAALQRGASDAGLGGAGSVGAVSARAAGGDAKQVAASTGDLSTVSTAVAATVRELGSGLHRVSGEGGATGTDASLLANLDPSTAVAAPGARNADAGSSESSRHGGTGVLGEGGAEPSFAVDGASGTASFEELAQTGAEELLAEQVTYWANQKTQSAEVTLNRDGQPLAVTVALSGNEAHVTFRSDQEHTREMLDQSMAQLSELLRGEGLVLSGMTVGTSAGQGAMAGDAGQQQRNRPGDGQQGQVLVSGPTDVSQRLAGSGTSNKGVVDVFV